MASAARRTASRPRTSGLPKNVLWGSLPMAMTSSTVKGKFREGDWVTTPTRRPRSREERDDPSRPQRVTVPPWGRAPPRARSRVLFPLPLGPRRKVRAPGGKSPEIPRRTVFPPYPAERSRTDTPFMLLSPFLSQGSSRRPVLRRGP